MHWAQTGHVSVRSGEWNWMAIPAVKQPEDQVAHWAPAYFRDGDGWRMRVSLPPIPAPELQRRAVALVDLVEERSAVDGDGVTWSLWAYNGHSARDLDPEDWDDANRFRKVRVKAEGSQARHIDLPEHASFGQLNDDEILELIEEAKAGPPRYGPGVTDAR